MKKISSLAILSLVIMLLSACAPGLGGKDYTNSQVQASYNVRYGTVVSVQAVNINKNDAVVGTAAGAVVGGVIGNMFGGGAGNTLATIGGALGGAAIGSAAEKKMGSQTGVEITVKLDNGETLVVVQGLDGGASVSQGQRVKVVSNGGSARVTPA